MKRAVWAAMLACLTILQSHAQSAYDREIVSKIMALERLGRLQAFGSKDLKTLSELLDDDFVSVNLEGQRLSKREVLDYVQRANSLGYITQEMVVRVHGDTVIVTGLFQISVVRRGKPSMRQGRFMDTWMNRDGHWVAIASLSTPLP